MSVSISTRAASNNMHPGNGFSIEIDTILHDKPKENLCVDKPHIVNIGKEDQLYILSFEKEQCAFERIFKSFESMIISFSKPNELINHSIYIIYSKYGYT